MYGIHLVCLSVCVFQHSYPIRTHTRTVKGHVRKGYALLALRDTVKATRAFQGALDLDPNNAVSGSHTPTSVVCTVAGSWVIQSTSTSTVCTVASSWVIHQPVLYAL